LNSYLTLIRPHQWLKNGFILMPAFFAGKIGLLFSSPRLLLATVSFCIVASAVYVFNDVHDRDRDKLHEIKRKRPIASDEIPVRNAVIVMIALAALGAGLALMVGMGFFFTVAGYVGINILYTLAVKHISLVDISFVAFGFVLRVLAGGIVAEVPVSKWIILMTFLLACCLALGKRRDDLLLDVDKNDLRPALSGYSLTFVDVCLVVLSVTTIVCYLMYTVSEEVVQRLHSDHIYLTSVFVIIGILRFLQIAIVEERSGSPTLILLKDIMIQVMVGLWIICFMVIIYASKTGN